MSSRTEAVGPEPVIAAKVRTPERQGLVRDRLCRRILTVGAAEVVLVTAPPGAGKSTLLAHVAAIGDLATAWYTAGAEDNREVDLVRHLHHAMAAALPEVDSTAEPADPNASRQSPQSLDGLLVLLQNHVFPPMRLIIDDVHEILGTPAELALERFLQLRPPQVRVLLASRVPLFLNTSRMLVSGLLVELDGDDLRFRSWEVEELFTRVYGEPLSPEAAAALTRRIDGWAAGLQLFHLSTAGRTRVDRDRAVAQLGGRSRLIRSYLTRNVIAGLPEQRRAFLLRTSTLGVLTGALCDEVLGETGSHQMLEDLELRQLFTSSSEDAMTFRYHQVLRSHLQTLLADELEPDEVRALYLRAAGALDRSGHHPEALAAYAHAGDWDAVTILLRRVTPAPDPDDLPQSPRGATWLATSDDPWIALARARRLLRYGSLTAAVAAFRRAETLMDDPEFLRRCHRERALATTLLSGPPSPMTLLSPEFGWSVDLRAVTRRVPPASPSIDAEPLVAGLARLLAGDLTAAAILGDLGRASRRGDWGAHAAGLAAAVADLLGGAGSGDVTGRLEDLAVTTDVEGLPWLARVARGLQACILLVSDPVGWRVESFAEILLTCHQDGDDWAALLLSLCGGAALQVSGQTESAGPLLVTAGALATSMDAPVLGVWVDAFADLGAAEPTLEPSGSGSGAGPGPGWQERARLLGVTGLERIVHEVARSAALTAPAEESPPPVHRVVSDPTANPVVQIQCLGGFSIQCDDRAVDLTGLRPQVLTLLQMLARRHGRLTHREYLIDALWPDVGTEPGRHRLQVAASSLRRFLTSGGWSAQTLHRSGDAYALRLPGALLDVDAVEEWLHGAEVHAAAGRLVPALLLGARAVEAYAGDLLPEAGPAEWVVAERDRLRTLVATIALDLARSALVNSMLSQGLPLAQRAVEVDPLRDSAWDVLAQIQAGLGDVRLAAVTRQEHARLFLELGVGELGEVGGGALTSP